MRKYETFWCDELTTEKKILTKDKNKIKKIQ